ncbi:universal stress protein UspA [Zobellella denitrificans]|uniref:Universal stress protein UspA n=1 Tax=Zobellella denitrificans TaxID=347534 RepID=A0A231N294_9GAMM|nr:universal stress protein [Zobellella denitrificans]ATG75329.1 universal stress protein UspA [Zobellella denitrificans]OXS16623.1 universal stress protein UspA [Zobellella denitrificans]
MAQINLIVYATDFSAGSAHAAELARQLTGLHGARLHLLHVITELHDRHWRGIPVGLMEEFAREVKTQAVADMHDFAQRFFGDFEGELTTDVVMGPAAEEILVQASALGADLIVMGTHGRSGVEQLLVGSTTERLIRKSMIPVLTVPERG